MANGCWKQPLYVCFKCGGAFHDPTREARWAAAHPKPYKKRRMR